MSAKRILSVVGQISRRQLMQNRCNRGKFYSYNFKENLLICKEKLNPAKILTYFNNFEVFLFWTRDIVVCEKIYGKENGL